MMRPKLVRNWKSSWKKFSVISLTLSTAVSGMYFGIPVELRSLIPPEIALAITGTVSVLGGIGSLIDQGIGKE